MLFVPTSSPGLSFIGRKSESVGNSRFSAKRAKIPRLLPHDVLCVVRFGCVLEDGFSCSLGLCARGKAGLPEVLVVMGMEGPGRAHLFVVLFFSVLLTSLVCCTIGYCWSD